jgi:hypothetical protein
VEKYSQPRKPAVIIPAQTIAAIPPEPEPPVRAQPSRKPWLAALALVAVVLAALAYFASDEFAPPTGQGQAARTDGQAAPPAPSPSSQGPVVEVPQPGQGLPSAQQLTEQTQRKKPYGLDKSLDAVLRSDETLIVGEHKVLVAELEHKLTVEQRGQLLDKPLTPEQKVAAWGVYLVRPGDNLWNIHYALLREYMAKREVILPPDADQPSPQGRSSGVGKVLKFAEHMVGVYNLKTGHMDRNLNLLEPGEKVVVFSLSEIFEQLVRIDPVDLDSVIYDGCVLLFPKRDQPAPPPPATVR